MVIRTTPEYNPNGLYGEDRFVVKGLYGMAKRRYPMHAQDINNAENLWNEGKLEEAKGLARKVLSAFIEDSELDVASAYSFAFGILEEVKDPELKNELRELAQPTQVW